MDARPLVIVGILGAGFFFMKRASASTVDHPTQQFIVPMDEVNSILAADGTIDTPPNVKPNSADEYVDTGVTSVAQNFNWAAYGDMVGASSNLPSDFDWGSFGNELEMWSSADSWSMNPTVESYSIALPDAMNTTQLANAIADFLMPAEAFVGYVYDDFNAKPWTQSQKGKPTIGYGHVVKPSEMAFYAANGIDELGAYQLLFDDIMERLLPLIPYVRVPLSVSQWVALISFAFNVGVGAVRGSTFFKLLNQGRGNTAEAEAAFKAWNKITVNGQKVVSRGLDNRRASEWQQFAVAEPVVYLA
jgi:GH24 family phage-related lysozyme (muramidase)